MESYLNIVKEVLEKGVEKTDRTGVGTISISGYMFKHDMNEGFPLLTTKKMSYKNIFSELEFFIKGYTDKQWLQDRKNHIWDEWCNNSDSDLLPENNRDLGPIYGYQWRRFNSSYLNHNYINEENVKECRCTTSGDQLKTLIDTLKKDKNSRRLIVSAWNPIQMSQMALPPCHVLWQIIPNEKENTIDLIWYQRSCDLMLGIPYNIASYACLLHLIGLEVGMKPKNLIGFLGDVHIYKNHIEGAKLIIERKPFDLPKIVTDMNKFKSIYDWEYTYTTVEDYKCHDKIKFEIAV